MIIGIVAVNNVWSIGENNDLLYRLKGDMKFFREKTKGAICVMGYNCYRSLPNGGLKGRRNIVLCTGVAPEDTPQGVEVFSDFEALVAWVKRKARTEDVYIIGGGMMYRSFIPYYDRIYITKIDDDRKGTVFFPNIDEMPEFACIDVSPEFEEDGLSYRFYTYTRAA